MIIPIPYVHLSIGFFTVILSVPLVRRKIPMNHIYGIRVRKAFVSDQNWYALNAYGGKLLLWFGVFVFCCGYFGFSLAPPPTSIWAPVFLVVPLSAIVPVIVLINRMARRLPE